ncbi:MAG: hypothetical protein CSYNP_02447 [Syntrophus sp. SKADARSKE-3]|nr:hypothetical protein [Syntrophus sp. SKADARSKE-3]
MPENRKKTGNRRFLNRVFTLEEQEAIGRADRPDAMLWALWAGKEGAYKALCKLDPLVVSIPKLYQVRYLTQIETTDAGPRWSGIADTPGGPVALEVVLATDYVHCLAMAGGSTLHGRAINGVTFQIIDVSDDADASIILRRAVAGHIAGRMKLAPSDIEIHRAQVEKGLGPPYVLIGGKPTDMDISLSHDGRYGAFAVCCRAK